MDTTEDGKAKGINAERNNESIYGGISRRFFLF
jgi:hypothetical protein